MCEMVGALVEERKIRNGRKSSQEVSKLLFRAVKRKYKDYEKSFRETLVEQQELEVGAELVTK